MKSFTIKAIAAPKVEEDDVSTIVENYGSDENMGMGEIVVEEPKASWQQQ